MGKIKVEKISPEEMEKRGIKNWGIWEKDISEFPWEYGQTEVCYIIEGQAEITDQDTGEKVIIKSGDLVTFSSGLNSFWKIIEPIKKYYNFE